MLCGFHEIELILGVSGLLIGGLAIIRRFCPCDPEVPRKALHVGMGVV
jgi:hypothetical protein